MRASFAPGPQLVAAISAFALIAAIEDHITLAKWLHWLIQHWKAAIDTALWWIPLRIPEPIRPALAFSVIILATTTYDAVVRLRAFVSGVLIPRLRRSPLMLSIPALLIGLIAMLVLTASDLAEFAGEVFRPDRLSSPYLLPSIAVVAISLTYSFLTSLRRFLWLVAFAILLLGANEATLRCASPVS